MNIISVAEITVCMHVCVCVCVCVCVQSCLALLWLHELQPSRLLCPWNVPGRNTGVDCHFLLRRESSSPRDPAHTFCIYLLHWQEDSLPAETLGKPSRDDWLTPNFNPWLSFCEKRKLKSDIKARDHISQPSGKLEWLSDSNLCKEMRAKIPYTTSGSVPN